MLYQQSQNGFAHYVLIFTSQASFMRWKEFHFPVQRFYLLLKTSTQSAHTILTHLMILSRYISATVLPLGLWETTLQLVYLEVCFQVWSEIETARPSFTNYLWWYCIFFFGHTNKLINKSVGINLIKNQKSSSEWRHNLHNVWSIKTISNTFC